jgi:hypothetical protein
MPRPQPRVFLGSSSEAKDQGIPEAFAKILRAVKADVVPWWLAREFSVAPTIIDGLRGATEKYDFAFFILTPDDSIESRGQKGKSARDNVLFEMGLFLGVLGWDRVKAVVLEGKKAREKVKIPSDLGGVIVNRFTATDADNLLSSADEAAEPLKEAIKNLGRRKFMFPIGGWGCYLEKRIFSVTLRRELLKEKRPQLLDYKLAVIARPSNSSVNLELDTAIVIGEEWPWSDFLDEDLPLTAGGAGCFDSVKDGDFVEGCLIRIPKKYNVRKAKTLGDMLDNGCDVADRVRVRARF